MLKHLHFLLILGLTTLTLTACPDNKLGVSGGTSPNLVGTPETVLTIKDSSQLIGGPNAQGRLGDVLLSNSKIKVIIQKPNKSAGIGSFGGTIIDADRVRFGGEGADRWQELFPLVNVEWTVNYFTYGVLADGSDGGAQILRAQGIIDVYDYLDLDFIADAASAVLNQQITFADRFDDRRDPFNIDPNLKDLYAGVITEYRLDPSANHVKIETTFTNPSDHPISMPIGDFLVGGGELQLLIPGIGFSPAPTMQLGQNTPAIIYAGFPGVDVSYGYFYDPSSFLQPKVEEDEEEQFYTTTSVSYAGLTGVLLGEEFLKILPLGSHASPEVHFTILPKSERTITRYFVVGDGSAGSVLDEGLKVLKVPTASLSGQVVTPNGASIEGATVAVKKLGGGTIVTYTSDAEGRFSGLLPTGEGKVGKLFGDGKYELWVDKKGYHENETVRAGNCAPSQIDLTKLSGAQIVCKLGETGFVKLAGGVTDAATGSNIPARLTIIGQDPSPETAGSGTFSDTDIFSKPFGVVDVEFVNAKGTFGLTSNDYMELEPGFYRFVFSHGTEYSVVERDVNVNAGGAVTLEQIILKKVVDSKGFVSSDFHIHALPSADSAFSIERRALAAAADGLDVLQSSDHDFLTDYAPVVAKLIKEGILKPDSIQTLVGDEITPNHFGHIHAFPLTPNFDDVDHGAIDWSSHSWDEMSPAPDYVLSPKEIVAKALQDPGEEVIQINHIADSSLSIPVATGWLTTPIYENKFKIPAFVSYADPIERRLAAPTDRAPAPPYGMGASDLILDTFTAMELTIGPEMNGNALWEVALPTWFNLLNLGLAPTATANSDSHHEIKVPLGIPRNFVAMDVDPRDGLKDSFAAINEEVYAHNINDRKVVVSAGPYISMTAFNADGGVAGVGEIIKGNSIRFDIEVQAPSWAWFDTIEIYANTEPLPAEDSGRFALRDEASDPAQFAKPYHIPHYIYDSVKRYKLSDGTLKNWSEKDGKITAKVELTINIKEDTWVVVAARGTPSTEGYRSLFPIVPVVLKDPKDPPKDFDPTQLEEFHKDKKKVGGAAWAFTNPIFIDVDGDTDQDGFPFEAKWVREGYSKLKPFVQTKQ